MKSSLEHLPEKKQRELARAVEIIEEEFADALNGASADFKKRGHIKKIILFGSYARGTWVDEPHTMKGYRSDYDILVIVNTAKLADRQYWDKAEDRLLWDPGVKTPVGLIVHGLREVNKALKEGQYFFTDIRRDGIVLHEIAHLIAFHHFKERAHRAPFIKTLDFLVQDWRKYHVNPN